MLAIIYFNLIHFNYFFYFILIREFYFITSRLFKNIATPCNIIQLLLIQVLRSKYCSICYCYCSKLHHLTVHRSCIKRINLSRQSQHQTNTSKLFIEIQIKLMFTRELSPCTHTSLSYYIKGLE